MIEIAPAGLDWSNADRQGSALACPDWQNRTAITLPAIPDTLRPRPLHYLLFQHRLTGRIDFLPVALLIGLVQIGALAVGGSEIPVQRSDPVLACMREESLPSPT